MMSSCVMECDASEKDEFDHNKSEDFAFKLKRRWVSKKRRFV